MAEAVTDPRRTVVQGADLQKPDRHGQGHPVVSVVVGVLDPRRVDRYACSGGPRKASITVATCSPTRSVISTPISVAVLSPSDPARFAKRVADGTYHTLFEVTGVVDLIQWVSPPLAPQERGLRPRLHQLYHPIAEFVLATLQVTQVFSLRLAILTLAMPVFVLFSLVALVDGSGATRSAPMGWGTGEFVRLSLREESGLTVVGDDLGDLPGAPVQSASDVCGLALCHRVCIDGRGHGQYLQEISVSGFTLVNALSGLKVQIVSGSARKGRRCGIGLDASLNVIG